MKLLWQKFQIFKGNFLGFQELYKNFFVRRKEEILWKENVVKNASMALGTVLKKTSLTLKSSYRTSVFNQSSLAKSSQCIGKQPGFFRDHQNSK